MPGPLKIPARPRSSGRLLDQGLQRVNEDLRRSPAQKSKHWPEPNPWREALQKSFQLDDFEDTHNDGDRCAAAALIAAAALLGGDAVRTVGTRLVEAVRQRLGVAQAAVNAFRAANTEEQRDEARAQLTHELQAFFARGRHISDLPTTLLHKLGWTSRDSVSSVPRGCLGVTNDGCVTSGGTSSQTLSYRPDRLRRVDATLARRWTAFAPPEGVALDERLITEDGTALALREPGWSNGARSDVAAYTGAAALGRLLYRLSGKEDVLHRELLDDLERVLKRGEEISTQLDTPAPQALQRLADYALECARREPHGLSIGQHYELTRLMGFDVAPADELKPACVSFADLPKRLPPGGFLATSLVGHAVLAARAPSGDLFFYDSLGLGENRTRGCLAAITAEQWSDYYGPLAAYVPQSPVVFPFGAMR